MEVGARLCKYLYYGNNNPVNLTGASGQLLIRPAGFWYDAPYRDGTDIPANTIISEPAKPLNGWYLNDAANDNIGGGQAGKPGNSVRITDHKRIIEELGKRSISCTGARNTGKG